MTLSSEQLAEIRAWADDIRSDPPNITYKVDGYLDAIDDLLAELERLRGRQEQLEQERDEAIGKLAICKKEREMLIRQVTAFTGNA